MPQGGVEPDAPVADPALFRLRPPRPADADRERHVGHEPARPALVPHPVPPRPLRRRIHAADRRHALHRVSRLQRRLGLGQRRGRSRARHPGRQLQRHAELQPPRPAREGGRRGHQADLRGRRAEERRRRPAPQTGAPYAIDGQRRLAGAADRAAVQAAALRRHPRHRPRDRQDALGPAARQRREQRPVRHPVDAAVHDRHAEQRRPAGDRRRADLHRRDRPTRSSAPSTPRPASRCGRPIFPPAARPPR